MIPNELDQCLLDRELAHIRLIYTKFHPNGRMVENFVN